MITTDLWQDKIWRKDLKSIETRFIWVYLLTCSQSKTCGIFQINMDLIAMETKLPSEVVERSLNELVENDLCLYNEKTEEIAIYNYPKYNIRNCGKPMIDLLMKELSQVHDKSLIWAICNHLCETIEDGCEQKKANIYKVVVEIYSNFLKEKEKTIFKERVSNIDTNIYTNTYTYTCSDTPHDTPHDTIKSIDDNEMEDILKQFDKKPKASGKKTNVDTSKMKDDEMF